MRNNSRSTPEDIAMKNSPDHFLQEVMVGLNEKQKTLPSKYFYDAEGDHLFQQIMDCKEYYLTRCEKEIFTGQTDALAALIGVGNTPFDLIELGAGDGSKTIYLLEYLAGQQTDFSYLPIDISGNILDELESKLSGQFPELKVMPLEGEYLEMLAEAATKSKRRKVILFLGSNIGNLLPDEAMIFCAQIRTQLQPGDIAIIGFDLKKNPAIIKAAYDDAQGITRAFNLNLLKRMNRELGADFVLHQFEHYSDYDPQTGACKSYLVSLVQQKVSFPHAIISFEEGECIWMEISQKYSQETITELASASGFEIMGNLTDSNGWFADAVWKAV